MNLTLIAALISAGLAGLAGWTAAWTWQGRVIDQIKLEAKDDRIAQQWAARQSIERATGALIQAQNAAARRGTDIRRDADGAASAGGGLRIAAADTVRAAAQDAAACAASAAELNDILGAATAEAERLAREADQWESTAVMFFEAWPR